MKRKEIQNDGERKRQHKIWSLRGKNAFSSCNMTLVFLFLNKILPFRSYTKHSHTHLHTHSHNKSQTYVSRRKKSWLWTYKDLNKPSHKHAEPNKSHPDTHKHTLRVTRSRSRSSWTFWDLPWPGLCVVKLRHSNRMNVLSSFTLSHPDPESDQTLRDRLTHAHTHQRNTQETADKNNVFLALGREK